MITPLIYGSNWGLTVHNSPEQARGIQMVDRHGVAEDLKEPTNDESRESSRH